MTTGTTKKSGIDRPTKIAIARWLATEAAARKDFEHDAGNYERDCMEVVADWLNDDPPRVAEALESAENGVGHAWRGFFTENRSEAWACAAAAELLSDAS